MHPLRKPHPLAHPPHKLIPRPHLPPVSPHHDLREPPHLLQDAHVWFLLRSLRLGVFVRALRRCGVGEFCIGRAQDDAGVGGGEGERGAVQVAAAEVDVGCTCREGVC